MEKRNTALQRIRERIPLRTRLEVLFFIEWGKINVKDPNIPLSTSEKAACAEWVDQITNEVLKTSKPYFKKAFRAGDCYSKVISMLTHGSMQLKDAVKHGYDFWESKFIGDEK